jgi:uncharacterized membrane protein YqjE
MTSQTHHPRMTPQTGESTSSSATAPATDVTDASTGELVTRLSTQLSELVRGELALARAELTEKGKKAGVGFGLAGAAGLLATYGGAALVAAVVAALALVLPVWAAALITGGVLLAVAGLLALMSKKQIDKATPMIPEQATEGVRRDVETVKGGLQR